MEEGGVEEENREKSVAHFSSGTIATKRTRDKVQCRSKSSLLNNWRIIIFMKFIQPCHLDWPSSFRHILAFDLSLISIVYLFQHCKAERHVAH